MPEIISRSWPSRYLATSQPLFSSWTRWLLGTFTLSKKVSQNGELPEISRIGLVETPSLAMSNRTKLIPHCFDSLEVRTRSEEHTSELQSLMRISYAVFCLKKKTQIYLDNDTQQDQSHHSEHQHYATRTTNL